PVGFDARGFVLACARLSSLFHPVVHARCPAGWRREPRPGSAAMVIRRVDPVSCAKLMGVCYALMGLLIGAFFSLLFAGLGSAMGATEGMEASGLVGVIFGAGAIVALPIMYGIMG